MKNVASVYKNFKMCFERARPAEGSDRDGRTESNQT